MGSLQIRDNWVFVHWLVSWVFFFFYIKLPNSDQLLNSLEIVLRKLKVKKVTALKGYLESISRQQTHGGI